VTALGKLFRTTASSCRRLFLVVFALGSGLVLGRVAWKRPKGLLDDQIGQTIEAEIKGLAEQYAQGGVPRLTAVIERRIREPGASLYLVANAAGERHGRQYQARCPQTAPLAPAPARRATPAPTRARPSASR
jgi:hypothetical protein